MAFRPGLIPRTRAAYPIDPKVLGMIADAGMLHLDLRHMDELSTEMYEDAVHLNEGGIPIYTRRLAHELERALRLVKSTGPKSSYKTYSQRVRAERRPIVNN